ncbi:MAG: hypothetical protein HY226_06480 [Candidatus Vogelbacteria bacterium]|nr:hypothetical protein [Candidatus Vogelbacteria bacterium]
MNGNVTKILIVVTLLLIFLFSGFGIYKYFSNSSVPSTPNQTNNQGPAFPQSPNNPAGSGTPGSESNTENVVVGRPIATSTTEVPGANFKIITTKPVSGSYFVEKTDTGSKGPRLYIRYSERETGHLYEIAYNENIPTELSNTTVTRVYESYFNSSGDTILYRRLGDDYTIQNIVSRFEPVQAPTSTEEVLVSVVGKLNQSPIQTNIKEVAISPDRSKLFNLTAISNDFVGTIENFGGKPTGRTQIFSSPLGEWQVQWPTNDTLFFNTKPSADTPGFLYSVSVNKPNLVKILGGINGLTTNINQKAKKLIYSESTGGWLSTYYFDLVTQARSEFPLKTLPEKCVWGGIEKDILYCAVPITPAINIYPDAWYQGVISFNDEIWQINTTTGQTKIITDKDSLDKYGGIDATKLQLSPNEDYLSFINKKDQSLWLVKLK